MLNMDIMTFEDLIIDQICPTYNIVRNYPGNHCFKYHKNWMIVLGFCRILNSFENQIGNILMEFDFFQIEIFVLPAIYNFS